MKQKIKLFIKEHEAAVRNVGFCVATASIAVIYHTVKVKGLKVIEIQTAFDENDKCMGAFAILKNGEVQPFFKPKE